MAKKPTQPTFSPRSSREINMETKKALDHFQKALNNLAAFEEITDAPELRDRFDWQRTQVRVLRGFLTVILIGCYTK